MSALKVGRIEQLTHTPGPWAAQDYEPPFWVEPPSGEDLVICDLLPREVGEFTDEDAANARLIAAAPDLLAACKHMVESWTAMDADEHASLTMARAAIAKAEGQ